MVASSVCWSCEKVKGKRACPARGGARDTLDGVAQNGIQLKVKARVTVRANLLQLIGGATEETIVARVGEGIVSAIGSAGSHHEVLENPDRISKAVLVRRLDSQTAFEIVSIDIADVDVGENIGARLQADQAEADMRVAQAKAEGRRAMAVAEEQELIDYCRGQIATFKVPRYVRFVTEWPMSGTKIQKFRLRDQITSELEAAGITEAPRITSGR